MQKRFDVVQDPRGNAVEGATVEILTYPGGGIPTIYSDDGVAVIAGAVLTTNEDGYFEYYAANGHYTWRITTNAGVRTVNDVIHDDSLTSNQQFAAATGTGNALVVAAFAAGYTLADGDELRVRAPGPNTVTNPTITLPGVGALTICRAGGRALAKYDIKGSGHELHIRYRAAPARAELINAGRRDSYNLKQDFGAACDGVTDDAAVWTAAIAAMSAGDTLYVVGVTKVASKITVNKCIRIVFDGGIGVNATQRPGSYILKAASLNDYAIEILHSAAAEGGGVVAEEGNGGDNIRISSNSAKWSRGYSENAGQDGWFHDGTNNANHCMFEHCRSYGNTRHGFKTAWATGNNSNATPFIGCFAQANGGDGFHSDKSCWNSFIACGADTNTGAGIRLKNGGDNTIAFGDYEGNAGGDIIIESTEVYPTLLGQNRGFPAADSGFYTRRLDRYRDGRGTYQAALRGSTGTIKTATAVVVAGAIATITSAAHGYANGQTVYHIDFPFPNTNLNGAFVISNVTANTYDITYRTDLHSAAPISAAGLAVQIQLCGVYTVARGDYVVEAGVCEAWGTITTSAITNITGTVQLILPFDGKNISASFNVAVGISYHTGITYVGRLESLLVQNGSRVANLYDTISGAPGAAAQFQAAGLAAVVTIVYHVRYRIADSH